ncbi:MAG: transposase [Candidatus Izemoplasmatales bacterium]|nr:transposase [Candidatus Izemoplasmatales bacterium]
MTFTNLTTLNPPTQIMAEKIIMMEVQPTSIIRDRELLVNIHCFCLMPNHYHLLLSTENKSSLTTFMRKVGTGYTLYFNEKYNRSGCLFQGRYKSIFIESNKYLIQLSKYIHLNPTKDCIVDNLMNYKYSSYLEYIGKKNLPSLIDKTIISKQFRSHNDYQCFVVNDEPINVKGNYRLD